MLKKSDVCLNLVLVNSPIVYWWDTSSSVRQTLCLVLSVKGMEGVNTCGSYLETGIIDLLFKLVSAWKDSESVQGSLTFICRDGACHVTVAKHGNHLLVVYEILRDQHRSALLQRRFQFSKHTRPSRPWPILGLNGLSCERIDREILSVQVKYAGGYLSE